MRTLAATEWFEAGKVPLVPRPVKRRQDLTFIDDEGGHLLVCVEAGDDEL